MNKQMINVNIKAYSRAIQSRVDPGFPTQLFPSQRNMLSVLHLPGIKEPALSAHLITGDTQIAMGQLQINQVRDENGNLVTANPSVKRLQGEKPWQLGYQLCTPMWMCRLKVVLKELFAYFLRPLTSFSTILR